MPPDQSDNSTTRWESEGGQAQPGFRRANTDELGAELAKYGVTAVHLTVFDWGGYRYTNAHDAIAAARRSA